jgi:hypothetical protein
MEHSLYNFDNAKLQNVTAVFATSGTFVMNFPTDSAGSYGGSPEVANPMPLQEVPYTVIEKAHESFTAELRQTFKQARYYSPSELASYSEKLVEIGKRLATYPIDLMLVPYRGGIAPSLQLQVMNKLSYQLVPIGFTQGSSPKHWNAIRDDLVNKLEPYIGEPSLTMGVIDTAVSGHSSEALAEILLMTKDHFKNQSWFVTFYLLHSHERYYVPPLSFKVPALSRSDLVFQIELFDVPSLLVDDWDAGIGIRADWAGEHCVYRPTGFGQMMVRQPDSSVWVVESPKINQYYDVLMSNFVTETMLADPSLRLRPPNDPNWNRL